MTLQFVRSPQGESTEEEDDDQTMAELQGMETPRTVAEQTPRTRKAKVRTSGGTEASNALRPLRVRHGQRAT